MLRKIVSGIMLTLVLVTMSIFTSRVQLTKASGTIYIRADGSIDPPTANITTADSITYYFTYDIQDQIVVERSNIIIDGAEFTLQGSGSGNGFLIDSQYGPVNGVTIRNMSIRNFNTAIYIHGSSNNNVFRNNIVDNYDGVGIYVLFGNYHSSYNNVSENMIANNGRYGVYIHAEFYVVGACHDNTISGNTITNNTYGVGLHHDSWDNNIISNEISSNNRGVYFDFVDISNVVFGNHIRDNDYGLYVHAADQIISENTVRDNDIGIGVTSSSSDNEFYHNDFINNTQQATPSSGYLSSYWDNGYPSGGNYWSDYSDRYPDAAEIDGSGIWDTPYVLDDNEQDNYPLMNTLSVYDVAVINISCSKTLIGQNYTGTFWVTVENQGDFSEVFNVSAFYDGLTVPVRQQWPTLGQLNSFWSLGDVNKDGYIDNFDICLIAAAFGTSDPDCDLNGDGVVNIFDANICASNYGLDIWTHLGLSQTLRNETIVELPSEASLSVAFRWNTTDVAKGNYTISATAETVPGETDTADNSFTDGWIIVAMIGDITGPDGWPDGKVEMRDVGTVARRFDEQCNEPLYHINYDLTGPTTGMPDGKIDMRDIGLVCIHFGEIDP